MLDTHGAQSCFDGDAFKTAIRNDTKQTKQKTIKTIDVRNFRSLWFE